MWMPAKREQPGLMTLMKGKRGVSIFILNSRQYVQKDLILWHKRLL
jgi:hypothetical protein